MKKFQILILVISTLIVFSKAITYKFAMDDQAQIVTNQLIKSIEHWPKLIWGSTFFLGDTQQLAGMYYKPLMMLSYGLIYQFFGLNPAIYHVVGLMLHMINGYLVYRALKPLLGSHKSWFASLVFLIHPINVEPVVYIACYQDLLFTLFGLLSLLMLQTKRYKLTLLMLALSLLSKETGVVYVGLVLMWTYLFERNKFRDMVKAVGILMLIYGWLRLKAVNGLVINERLPIADAPLWVRLMTLPKILWFYISTFIAPISLSFSHQWIFDEISFKNFWMPLLWLTSLGGGLFYSYRKSFSKEVIFFICWLGLGFLIHSNIFPLDMTVADRWFYTPMIGLLGLLLLKLKRMYLWLGIIPILLIIRSNMRVNDWQNELTLAKRDISVNGSDFMVENILGMKYIEEQQYSLAVDHLLKSVANNPRLSANWYNLGLAYEKMDNLNKAYEAYNQSLANGGDIYPVVAKARLVVEHPFMNHVETQKYLNDALVKYPDSTDLKYLKELYDQAVRNYFDKD